MSVLQFCMLKANLTYFASFASIDPIMEPGSSVATHAAWRQHRWTWRLILGAHLLLGRRAAILWRNRCTRRLGNVVLSVAWCAVTRMYVSHVVLVTLVCVVLWHVTVHWRIVIDVSTRVPRGFHWNKNHKHRRRFNFIYALKYQYTVKFVTYSSLLPYNYLIY